MVGLLCSVWILSAVELNSGVRVQPGDDAAWASPRFDDSGWKETELSRVNPYERIQWLRMTFDAGEDFGIDEPYAIYVSGLFSAEIFVNGHRLGTKGQPGASRRAEVPGNIDAKVYLPGRAVRAGVNTLALRISQFHAQHRLHRPVHFVAIAPYGEGTGFLLSSVLPALAASGAILLGAIYFFGLYLAQRRTTTLLLSLLSVSIVLQFAAEGLRTFIDYPYSWHLPRLWAVHSFGLCAGHALVAYIGLRFAPRALPHLLGAAVLGALTLTVVLPGYDTKSAIALLWLVLVAALGAALGWRSAIAGARVALSGLVGFGLVAVFSPMVFLDGVLFLSAYGLVALLFIGQIFEQDRLRRSAEEADIRAIRVEAELLRRLIEPHFLMNTLTSLVEWMETEPQTGAKMITALGEEYRLINKVSGAKLIPIEEELLLCERHLQIMSFRTDVDFHLETDLSLDTFLMPPTVLLTVLENALTHNRYAGAATFRCVQRVTDREIEVEVTTPAGSPRPRPESSGAGGAYIEARLQEAFGDRWSLDSQPGPGTSWRTRIAWHV